MRNPDNCPICGSTSTAYELSAPFWVVFCDNKKCRCNMKPFAGEENAVMKWNERTVNK